MSTFATREGTEKFFRFHSLHPDKKRVFDDLFISSISLGTYLGDADERTDDAYIEAISLAVSGGVNAIDTAINYRKQRSERLIGKAIKELSLAGVTRDQLIISTKGGYLPSDENASDYEDYIRAHYIDKGILEKGDLVEGSHSISPKFLAKEIDHSLHNLGLQTIDLYYLHNPEVQLIEHDETVFEDKLLKAFELLESKVSEGKIKRYGLATWNGFRKKRGAKGLLSLSKCLEIAEIVGGKDHHFKAVQLPINLVMLEALKVGNQEIDDEILTAPQLALRNNIAVMASSPFMQSHIFQLPSRVFDALPDELTSAMKALQFILSKKTTTSAIVGMKNSNHIHENLKVLERANWSLEQIKEAKNTLGLR